MSTHNLVKKHSGLQAEIAAHEQRIQAVCDQAGKLIEEGIGASAILTIC